MRLLDNKAGGSSAVLLDEEGINTFNSQWRVRIRGTDSKQGGEWCSIEAEEVKVATWSLTSKRVGSDDGQRGSSSENKFGVGEHSKEKTRSDCR